MRRGFGALKGLNVYSSMVYESLVALGGADLGSYVTGLSDAASLDRVQTSDRFNPSWSIDDLMSFRADRSPVFV